MNTHHHADGERGSVSIELAVLAPALLAFIALIVVAGRVALAGQSVQTAAAQAARETSLERTPAAGKAAGRATATRVLADQDLDCAQTSVDVDATDLGLTVGRAGTVTVDVTCRVPLSDIGLPGLPGTKVLRSSSTIPVDAWVAR